MSVPRDRFTQHSRRLSSLLHKALGPHRGKELNQQGLKLLESIYFENGQIRRGIKRLNGFLGMFDEPGAAGLLFEILCRLHAKLDQPEKVEEITKMWRRRFDGQPDGDEQMDRIISLVKELEGTYG
jgi:hypothetical protein